jgi:hypothetical protein
VVQGQAVGEIEAVGHDPGRAVFDAHHAAVGRGTPEHRFDILVLRGIGNPQPLLGIHEGKVGRAHPAALGVGQQNLVAAVGPDRLHLAVADVGHDAAALGVDADAVGHPAQLAEEAGAAVRLDVRALAAGVRRVEAAVIERHHPFGAHDARPDCFYPVYVH